LLPLDSSAHRADQVNIHGAIDQLIGIRLTGIMVSIWVCHG